MLPVLIAAWLLLGIANATAQSAPVTPPCRADKVSNTAGLLLSLISGRSYQGYPGSGATLSQWLPLDRVKICHIGGIAVQITNLSKQDKTIKALQIFPKNGGGLM